MAVHDPDGLTIASALLDSKISMSRRASEHASGRYPVLNAGWPQRPHVGGRPAILLEATGSADRRQDGWLEELELVQHAQIDASVAVPVQQHRRLLPNETRDGREHLPGSRRLDEQLGAAAARSL